MIAVYDLRTREWGRWYPAPNPRDRGSDVHHFNTVRQVGNQVWIIAHQFGPSELLVYDYPTLDLHSGTSIGTMAHDIFWYRGVAACCSSGEGCIVNRQSERLRTGGFPRGVAMTEMGNLVGISLHAPRADREDQSAILRWYTSQWHFVADYVLPAVGMVLDLISVPVDRYDWERVDLWSVLEPTRGKYNGISPGNTYGPDVTKHVQNRFEWHGPEQTHSWTAAQTASLRILICPNETQLRIEVSSACPDQYGVEIVLNGMVIGEIMFERPGVLQRDFCIESAGGGEHLLTFRVPYLWKPSERIAGSGDERALGIAVHSVALMPGLVQVDFVEL